MQRSTSPKHVRLAQNHMATTFVFTVSCKLERAMAAEEVLAECHKRVGQLENELSEFLPQSGIYQLNRAPLGESVFIGEAAIACLESSELLRQKTRGNFDVLVKSDGERGIGWDASSGHAWRVTENTIVSFAAIGKGFALDEVRILLEREGFRDFLLSAGGSSVMLSGFAAPGEPWSWGWSWEKDQEQNPLGVSFSHTSGECVALGISGTHEKGTHLMSPLSGEKAQGYRSALVGRANAAEADALSTALFVGGWDNAAGGNNDELGALAVIENDGTPRWNGLFQKYWGKVVGIALSFISSAAFSDEPIDLSALGADDFTPYLFERNEWWVLLPALSLVLVLIHLIRPPLWRTRVSAGESNEN